MIVQLVPLEHISCEQKVLSKESRGNNRGILHGAGLQSACGVGWPLSGLDGRPVTLASLYLYSCILLSFLSQVTKVHGLVGFLLGGFSGLRRLGLMVVVG